MTRMGIRQLRDNLTATIRRVRAGEVIEVTHDGMPVAMLVPIPPDRITRLLVAGATAPRALTSPTRRFPATSGLTSEEALEALRADR